MLVIISKNINAISNTLKNYVFIYKPSLFHSHPFAVNLLKFRRENPASLETFGDPKGINMHPVSVMSVLVCMSA